MNIKLSPLCMQSRTRKVYLQCESGLSFEDEENIKKYTKSGIMNIKFYPSGLPVQSTGKMINNINYVTYCSIQDWSLTQNVYLYSHRYIWRQV